MQGWIEAHPFASIALSQVPHLLRAVFAYVVKRRVNAAREAVELAALTPDKSDDIRAARLLRDAEDLEHAIIEPLSDDK